MYITQRIAAVFTKYHLQLCVHNITSVSVDFSLNTKRCFVQRPWQGTDYSKNISFFIRLNLLAGSFYMQNAKKPKKINKNVELFL